jgi:hypothetical protein
MEFFLLNKNRRPKKDIDIIDYEHLFYFVNANQQNVLLLTIYNLLYRSNLAYVYVWKKYCFKCNGSVANGSKLEWTAN